MLSYVLDGCLIAPWELLFYVSVITFLAVLRLHESILINTFAFCFFWGFKSLLRDMAAANPMEEDAMILYVFSGLLVYILIHLSYLQARSRREARSAESPLGAMAPELHVNHSGARDV
jgi:hypothetical protein